MFASYSNCATFSRARHLYIQHHPMRFPLDLFLLPKPLLLLLLNSPWLVTANEETRSSANLDDFSKQEKEAITHNAAIIERLAAQTPIGVRKMSDDPGEMFFLDYWLFEPSNNNNSKEDTTLKEQPVASLRHSVQASNDYSNSTLLPPFLQHSNDFVANAFDVRNTPRDVLQKRAFQCPMGTSSCTSIQRPNSCCANDEVCTIVQTSALGDVGCCPKGMDCTGSVLGCDTARGYTSCPGNSNGGCCIPNYSCEDVGCKSISVKSIKSFLNSLLINLSKGAVNGTSSIMTVTVSITPNASFTTSTIAPPSRTTETITPPSSMMVVTVYTTLPPNTDTVVVSAAGSPVNETTSTTIVSASAPERPTSMMVSNVPVVTSSATVCPTGYYMCSAYVIGGCCQVGRNCDTTSCPISASNTIISDGKTIIVPGTQEPVVVTTAIATSTAQEPNDVSAATVATGIAAANSGCANGWYGCGQIGGGGCCPSGYACEAQCSATAAVNGPSAVAKAPTASQASHLPSLASFTFVVAVLITMAAFFL